MGVTGAVRFRSGEIRYVFVCVWRRVRALASERVAGGLHTMVAGRGQEGGAAGRVVS